MEQNNMTAVEWLYDELTKNNNSNDNVGIQINREAQIWERAKQMEKEQMFGFTKKFHIVGKNSAEFYTEEFEKYYKETYGKDNNMAQKTVVEWLTDVYRVQGRILPTQFDQAKQMENEKNVLLDECILQFEYLNEKFGETATTNLILTKLKTNKHGK